MEGTADAHTLNLKVRNLAGEQLYEVSFPPVG